MKKFLSLVLTSSMILQTLAMVQAAEPVDDVVPSAEQSGEKLTALPLTPKDVAPVTKAVQEEGANVPTLFSNSNKCGENLTWTLAEGKLTISGTGDMYNYTGSANVPWYSQSKNITAVEISEAVTSIGAYAFIGCSALETVEISEIVKSIGNYAFGSCTSLKSITIPDSVESLGSSPFSHCTSLETVYIGNGLTSIGSIFSGFQSLKSVILGSGITSLDGYAFSNCVSLETVTIGDSVTEIGNYAFEECTNLKTVNFGSSVETIGILAFSSCTSLTSVTIPDSVTAISKDAFWGCTSITSIALGERVKILEMDYNSMEMIDILSWLVLYTARELTSISVNIGNPYYTSEDGIVFNKNKTVLLQYPSGKSEGSYTIPDSIETIGEDAFLVPQA